MSENNLNNLDIMRDMSQPNAINAANFHPNVIITMMKKELKFNLDPNIQDNLAQYINENNAFSSKGKIQEQVIQNLINQTSKLSQSINELITHCKEKYDDTDNKILDFANNIENQFSNINKDILYIYSSMIEFKNEQDKINKSVNEQINQHQEFIKKIMANLNDNETVKKKVESIEKILGENDIKIEIKNEENKEIKNIDIQEYATNLDKKELRLKFFAKNNTLFFKDITKDCEGKENEFAEKFKVILKKDKDTEKGITYQVSTLGKDWDFSRHMKNILRRLNFSRFNRRINIRNYEYVFKMVWTNNQVQFVKTPATPKFINYNKFFVKIGNNMVYVNNRRRFFRRNFNNFRMFRKDKNNNYNIKNYQNLSSKNNNQNNRNLNNKYRNNKNKNNRNNAFNNRNYNNYYNKRYYNNNNRFNNIRKFNRSRYNNIINKNTIRKVIKLLPKLINNNRNLENRPLGQNFQYLYTV